ncbi:MAG: 1,4-dihydroxy-2-naphthoate octaprenyltransferase [Anaerolineae bacterium]|nr:1,4-dihydroxy-2-naphthoate octaprenyltransferase [Anaerolineae bacterium]
MSAQQPAVKMPPLWIVKLRAPFFTATIVPICLGAAVAWATTGVFHAGYFLLTLLAALCLHAGTNMTNDYFDHTWGSDEINTEFASPFTGGSRLIQMGIVRPEVYLREGLFFFALGSLIGVILWLTRGPWVLWLGLIGLFSGYFYTAPPLRLAGTGLGELLIGLNFGPLMVLGSYYTLTQQVSWEPVLISLPVGILIALVVWINQFQDMRADAAVGKHHWVVRLGRRRAARVYELLLALTYLTLIAAVLLGAGSPFSLLGLLTVPLAIRACRVARAHYDHPRELVPANAATIQIHLLTGGLITLGCLIQGILEWLL